MRVLGFDWDAINTGKVLGHDLHPDDIEALVEAEGAVIVDHPRHAGRKVAVGFVPDGRFILVALEYDVETRWVRVVTAHEAEHERWWKIVEAKAAGARRRR